MENNTPNQVPSTPEPQEEQPSFLKRHIFLFLAAFLTIFPILLSWWFFVVMMRDASPLGRLKDFIFGLTFLYLSETVIVLFVALLFFLLRKKRIGKFKKTFFLSIFLLCLTLISIGFQLLINIPVSQVDDSAPVFKGLEENELQEADDWKTYRNEEYGFEFEYPEFIGSFQESSKSRLNCESSAYNKSSIGHINSYLNIGISCISEPDVYVQNENYTSAEKVNIDNTIAYLYDYVSPVSYNNKEAYVLLPSGLYATIVHSTKGGYVDEDGVFVEEREFTIEELEQILSTFKLLDSEDDSNLIWDEQTISLDQKSIITADIPSMQVSEGAVFKLGSGEFKDVQLSPDGNKVAFSVRNASHDFAWVYDFQTETFIPLSFQYGGGADVLQWESDVEVTFQLRTPKPSTETKTFDLNNLSQYPRVVIDGPFSYEIGEPYADVRARVLYHGWNYYEPEGFERPTYLNPDFPEIGDCGSGIDAICHVNFKKGEKVRHLNLQKVGRSGYEVWTVVGSE